MQFPVLISSCSILELLKRRFILAGLDSGNFETSNFLLEDTTKFLIKQKQIASKVNLEHIKRI